MTAAASAPESETTPIESLLGRLAANVRTGNVGSAPVIVALGFIVLAFSFEAQNFFTPGNFTNIITQMAGTCLIAYGIVFVLLIGEIDLSVSFISGMAGAIVAELQLPTGPNLPWYLCVFLAVLAATAIGAFQGSVVAIVGVPSFVVTLAGFEIWQGAIQNILGGVVVIQDNMINNFSNYFFSESAGWIMVAVVSAAYVGGMLGAALSGRRHGIPIRDPMMLALKVVVVPVVAVVTVWILNKDRGVPFALLLMVGALLVWTFVAKRTTFGRHIYAVGGNAEAARRAGINVPRVRILVFMIAGAMSGLGGIVLAARLNSVDLNAGGGTLLIDAISAAVIGGTSLFGGRGGILGTMLGGLIVYAFNIGLSLAGVDDQLRVLAIGVLIIVAVAVDQWIRKVKA
jgi:D-xylose transport system permease protein